jgi:hypothetical protein
MNTEAPEERKERMRREVVIDWVNASMEDASFLVSLLDRMTADWSYEDIENAYEEAKEGADE